jgi:uncharacterized protein YndB with AHSA1/START domain
MADTFTVERSTTIAAPPEAIHPHIVDLRRWVAWSPWEDLDPDIERSYSGPETGIGSSYAWSGNKKAGKGTMEIIDAEAPRTVRITLRFEKPFKAESETFFTVTPEGAGSTVTWTLTGKNTLMTKVFGLFKSMDSMIGPDFEKGLARLKQVSES